MHRGIDRACHFMSALLSALVTSLVAQVSVQLATGWMTGVRFPCRSKTFKMSLHSGSGTPRAFSPLRSGCAQSSVDSVILPTREVNCTGKAEVSSG